MDYDLIIIGSGSVGSAAGYYAAESGLKVLMVDSGTPPHNSGSHHGGTRIIRSAYGEGAMYVPLVLHSTKLWYELEQKTGLEILDKSGILSLGPRNSKFISSALTTAQEFNINVVKLSGDEVNARWSTIKCPKDYVGIYEPDSGLLKSEIAVSSFIKLSKEAGAQHLFDTTVHSVTPCKNGVEVVTNSGTYRGRKAVVTAGTWVKTLLPDMPITPLRKVISWHEADKHHFDMPGLLMEIDGSLYYSLPKDAKYLKIGIHYSGQTMEKVEELVPFGSFEEDYYGTDIFLREYLPGVGKRLHGDVCSYCMSPDKHFIIDTVPGCEELMVITGLSGHGFKFATALGEIAALFAQGKEPSCDISTFDLQRFEVKGSRSKL